MTKLLKAELFKLFKEKAFLVCLLIVVGFSVLIGGVLSLSNEGAGMGRSVIYMMMSIVNNAGIVILAAVAIILCKDFSYGTIRNSITSGHSRLHIFFSKLFSGAIIFFTLEIVNLGLTSILSLLLLDYGVPITGTVILNLLRDIGLCFFIYMWALTLMLVFIFLFKKSVFALLATLGVLLGLVILTQIFGSSGFDKWVRDICSFVPLQQLNDMAAPQTTESILKIIIMNVLLSGAHIGLGIYIFYKSDLK